MSLYSGKIKSALQHAAEGLLSNRMVSTCGSILVEQNAKRNGVEFTEIETAIMPAFLDMLCLAYHPYHGTGRHRVPMVNTRLQSHLSPDGWLGIDPKCGAAHANGEFIEISFAGRLHDLLIICAINHTVRPEIRAAIDYDTIWSMLEILAKIGLVELPGERNIPTEPKYGWNPSGYLGFRFLADRMWLACLDRWKHEHEMVTRFQQKEDANNRKN
jgi:hypothetical protein